MTIHLKLCVVLFWPIPYHFVTKSLWVFLNTHKSSSSHRHRRHLDWAGDTKTVIKYLKSNKQKICLYERLDDDPPDISCSFILTDSISFCRKTTLSVFEHTHTQIILQPHISVQKHLKWVCINGFATKWNGIGQNKTTRNVRWIVIETLI